MTQTDLLAAGYRMAGKLVHRMTDDLTRDEFYHVPAPGANPAAWVVGHLAVTLFRTAVRMDATVPMMPADVVAKFTQTGKPAEAGTDYGDPKELVRLFDECLAIVIASVQTLPLHKLDGATTVPIATNYGEGMVFGAMHIAMHSGQLSLIRRSLGKPPVV